MVEDSNSALASMKCHSDEVISSVEYLTSFDEPTTADNDKMKGLECVTMSVSEEFMDKIVEQLEETEGVQHQVWSVYVNQCCSSIRKLIQF